MALSLRESSQAGSNWQNFEDQCAINSFQNLLDDNATPELAANEVASSYENRLLAGKTDLWSLWKLICLAILHPLTTDRNLERLAETLVHITRLPDVVVHGKVVECNGRQYWHDIPEFSFWYGIRIDIDEGRTQISWSEQARQFEVANRFGALLLDGIDPDLSSKVSRRLNQLALTTIRDGLEVSIESAAQIRRAGIYVPAAAQWLLHATPVIWAFCKSKEGYDGEKIWKEWLGGSDGSKPTWTGDDGYSVER
ncbi:hypothetical protein E4T44_00484 [Aureobasidium sp. EXF-8845]|nr:hypothetical protein E4T44_00484 [Aureobasidium sp. EXF-8845]KAI4857955.1 hypothetical protein E4T45_00542 [Aureobasidium sp. EXF-8846]